MNDINKLVKTSKALIITKEAQKLLNFFTPSCTGLTLSLFVSIVSQFITLLV